MKTTVLALLFALSATVFAADLDGFYKTVDDKTGNAKSIVRIYKCGDAICGRIVALYDEKGAKIEETLNAPSRVAEEVSGSPKMAGLDIIWNMKPDKDEFSGGKILDPKSGKVYTCVIWQDKKDAKKLNVKGKIGPIGRTQVWSVFDAANLPEDLKNLDVSKWTPKIIK
jgi:uncharacterized protein (DUF2147 family)